MLRLLQIVVKEIVIENTEASKGLLEYINSNSVTNIVLGASSRSALGRLLSLSVSVAYSSWQRKELGLYYFCCRKYWTHDVPTLVNKAAPEFCSVYVVSKGKQQSVRPAAKSLPSCVPARQPSSSAWSAPRSSNSGSEDSIRYKITK